MHETTTALSIQTFTKLLQRGNNDWRYYSFM